MRSPADVARIAAALERPGIDPRTWTTLAVVEAVNATDKGVYCDITTIVGIQETAVLAPSYGGNGYGFYAPIEVGHMVVVEVPEGEWSAGARIIGHVWDGGDPPPAEVVDHPQDVALVVKPGKTIRIIASGGGNVVIEARDKSQVRLGNEEATRGVARIDDSVALNLARIQAILDLRYAQIPPAGPLPRTLPDAAVFLEFSAELGSIATASDDVKSS